MLKYNCRYFTGDRPCKFHKKYEIKCNSCDYYYPIGLKILIIKLDAIGDVLRTTSILPPLKQKYPDSYITWCTKQNASALFSGNNYVDEIITIEEDTQFRLMAEEFDIVINLDSSKMSSAIATSAKGEEKMGFVLNEKGSVIPKSAEADSWLQMSAFDDVKRKNRKTYQQIIYDIAALEGKIAHPILNVSDELLKLKKNQFIKNGFNPKLKTVGLNVGVGTKWPNKGWPMENWIRLIKLIKDEKLNIFLLGGPDEQKIMHTLSNQFIFLINTGFDNNIKEFAAIVNLCDVVITADTFALHVATTAGKKIIAMFGPTSMAEVELYENGIKLHSAEECKCFYNKTCTESVSCMQKISADEVYSALGSLIKL
ncbi:MAG: glycosyltransferase family 9 protein [Ignavibacteria bacterium]|nr:MAG: glycosyltransferase family 9 protein [Ignavibacteria bacterium]